MIELVSQGGVVVAVVFVLWKVGLDFVKWYIIWRAKQRAKKNNGQFPAKLDRRCSDAVTGNPGNSGTARIVEKLDSLEKLLCIKLDAIQATATEIRKGKTGGT